MLWKKMPIPDTTAAYCICVQEYKSMGSYLCLGVRDSDFYCWNHENYKITSTYTVETM